MLIYVDTCSIHGQFQRLDIRNYHMQFPAPASEHLPSEPSSMVNQHIPVVNIQKAIENGPFIADLPIKNSD